MAKGGWHPKGKDGKSKESWRGDFKGINQVAGWMGKGKGPNTGNEEHISQPLSTLKDPAAFGPPPKNVNYHGGAALSNQITPDTRRLGAPLSKDQIRAKQEAEDEAQRQAEEEAKPKGPPVPFRADTTGLSTAHLPPPPRRKDGADGRSPVSTPAAAKPKPSLPPRLPPRQNSNPAPSPPPAYAVSAEPDAHKGVLNQGSLNRLGAAGVSVPGFGINQPKSPVPLPAPSSPSRSSVSSQPSGGNASQLNELQSRFSRLSSTSSKPETPSEGTTFAQKQAAFKTASSFRNDPSSVSFSDARAAGSTVNNFRERHGEQVKSGWQSANKLNTKYGLSDNVSPYGSVGNLQPVEPRSSGEIEMRDNSQEGPVNNGQESAVVGKKKPPPPPVKRADLTSSRVSDTGMPPPIPLASKPKPQVSSYT